MKKLFSFLCILPLLTGCAHADGSGFAEKDEAAYVRLRTSSFDHNLSDDDTNVQAAMETLDDLIAGAGDGLFSDLADPNADRIAFWDDSAGSTAWLSAASPFAISGTSLVLDGPLGETYGGGGAATYQASLDNLTAAAAKTPGQVLTVSGSNHAVFADNPANLFTDSSTPTYLTDLDEELVIGGNTVVNGAKETIYGTADQVPLVLKMHSSPTTNAFEIKNSSSTNIYYVDNAGGVTMGDGSTAGIWAPVGATSVTTDAAGETGFDTNAWATGHGAHQVYDGTANGYVVAATASDTPTNQQVPQWNTGGTITWEAVGLIQSGSAPTVGAAGQIGVDTTDDQLKLYGSATRVIPYTAQHCFVIESLASTDDNYAFYMSNDPETVTGVGCNCRGTCSTGATFTLEDRGGNAMTITGTNPTCGTTGAATYAAVTSGNQVTAGEMVAFDVTNTPTAGDTYEICITTTTDAQ